MSGTKCLELNYFVFMTTQWSKYCYPLLYVDEDLGAQRGSLTCSRPNSKQLAEFQIPEHAPNTCQGTILDMMEMLKKWSISLTLMQSPAPGTRETLVD